MNEALAIFDATLVGSVPRFVAPILLAALGGLVCDRAGVFNVALEGLMLTGAFAAVAGSFYGGPFAGVVAAVVAAASRPNSRPCCPTLSPSPAWWSSRLGVGRPRR